jgi:hypothetical protein
MQHARERYEYKILASKPEGERLLGRHRRRGKDIRMNLTEIGWDVLDWFYLAQDRDDLRALVNTVILLLCSVRGGEFLVQLSD